MGAFIHAPPPGETVLIVQDFGGLVKPYEDAVTRYNREGRRVEIRGQCNSACTLALAVRNVCVDYSAVVRWHQAYDSDTGRLRPDVTERMLNRLPSQFKTYLEGKIQKDYSVGATLYYKDLLALGVQDCDSPAWKANTVQASVQWKEPLPTEQKPTATNNITSNAPTEYQPTSPQEQREMEWAKYWEWAANTSKKQFGSLHVKKYNFGRGKQSINIYYWDNNRQYVSAILYTQDGIPTERRVCRGDDVVPDELTCTDWTTGTVKKYELDIFTDKYEEVTG